MIKTICNRMLHNDGGDGGDGRKTRRSEVNELRSTNARGQIAFLSCCGENDLGQPRLKIFIKWHARSTYGPIRIGNTPAERHRIIPAWRRQHQRHGLWFATMMSYCLVPDSVEYARSLACYWRGPDSISVNGHLRTISCLSSCVTCRSDEILVSVKAHGKFSLVVGRFSSGWISVADSILTSTHLDPVPRL